MNSVLKEDIDNILSINLPYGELRRKTVLISGVSGFIAGYIAEVLLALKDVKVIGLVRNIEKAKNKFKHHKDNKNLIILKQDISEEFNIEGDIDYIIHAASNASPHLYSIDPVGTIDANVSGTQNLLKIGIRKHVKKFIYLSSGAVYGDLDNNSGCVDETYRGKTDFLNLRSCYDESKRMGELLCLCYAKQYNIPVNMVRISYAYGPNMDLNDTRVFAAILNKIIENKDIELNSDGSACRNFCYITDMVKSIFLILLKGKSPEAYNVASESETSIKELAMTFAALNEKRKTNVIFLDNYKYLKTNTCRGNFSCKKLKKLDKKLFSGGGQSVPLKKGIKRILDYLKEEKML